MRRATVLTHLDPDGDKRIQVRCVHPDEIELSSPFDRAALALVLGSSAKGKVEDEPVV